MTTKPSIKTEFFPMLMVIIAIVASFYFYFHMPAVVPTHWNLAGQPNQWSPKAFAAFFFPGLIAGIYLLMVFLPSIDPKKERYEQFARTFHLIKGLLIFVFTAIYFIASLNAIGYNIPVNTTLPAIIGVLFLILGNYMGKLKPNWFIGIRTPWTLSNEEVWNKTHRLGGKLFILAGLVMILQAFIPLGSQIPFFIVFILLAAIVPIVYSYVIYKRVKK